MEIIKDLPTEVLKNIVRYTHGEPSEALKRIQNKYKIARLGPKITTHREHRKRINIKEYCIMREEVSFSLKCIEDIVRHEREELLSLIFEVEDNLDYKVKLDIQVQVVAKLSDREYDENEFSFRDIYFLNAFDEYINEDNMDEVLCKAVEEIKTDIEEDQDKNNMIGIQAFHFRLIIIEDV